MKNKEVELKFVLNNTKALKGKLAIIAERQNTDQYQKDTYYTPCHKDFLKTRPIAEWLRIRQTHEHSTINYKNWHTKDGSETVSCDELETSIGNPQQIANILSNLDFQELVVVEKNRNTWNYKRVEIAIDDVSQLGAFIEIEAKGEFSSVEEAKKYIYAIAKELEADLGAQEFRGYPYRILELKGYKF